MFLGIYSCEMVIKAVAKGLLLDRLTYLRSPWNWLDFVVILSGYATLAVEIGNLAGLRTFRVLRALKTVSIIPGTAGARLLVPRFRSNLQRAGALIDAATHAGASGHHALPSRAIKRAYGQSGRQMCLATPQTLLVAGVVKFGAAVGAL